MRISVEAEISSLNSIIRVLDGLLHSLLRGDMSNIPDYERDNLQIIYDKCRALLRYAREAEERNLYFIERSSDKESEF